MSARCCARQMPCAAAVLLLVAHAAFALTIEAQHATIRTVGGAQKGVWNLWSDGEVGEYVRFAGPGSYTVTVRAFGTVARGVWPLMAVCVDGVVADQVAVQTEELKEYAFQVEAGASVYRITVAFLNDFYSPGEDRNLYLGTIEIRASEGTPAPVLASAEQWQERWGKEMEESEQQGLWPLD